MKFIIAGGTGQIGAILSNAFTADRHDVAILSRKPADTGARTVAWDGVHLGPWASEIDGADVVINLAGRSVNCRYTPKNRRLITESRVNSTRIIGEAIAASKSPPKVWLQAGTATIYAHRYDSPNDEETGILGGAELGAPDTWRFSIDVARAWEQAAIDAVVPKTRKILLRTAMVMSPHRGGVFDVLLALVRWGLGGKQGDGRQYVSWIHYLDFVRVLHWLIEHDLDGAVNVASPNPVPNAEFMRTLRIAWGKRWGLPSPRWMLEVGAFFMRTETELILKSRRVIPARLLSSGFRFEYSAWREAADDLCRKWRVDTGTAA